MLQGGVGSQDGVVGLNHSCRDLRCWVDGKLKFGLLAVVNRKALHEEGGEARSCTTPKGMKDQEALKATALVGLKEQTKKMIKTRILTVHIIKLSNLSSKCYRTNRTYSFCSILTARKLEREQIYRRSRGWWDARPTKSDLKSEQKLGSCSSEKTKKTDETWKEEELTVRTKITKLNRKQIYHFPGFIQHIVDVFLADSVVATSIVISSVFLACKQLVRVE